ncbi:MAG: hypothetical protein OHK0046_42620 [Anaerolineae bacterium]
MKRLHKILLVVLPVLAGLLWMFSSVAETTDEFEIIGTLEAVNGQSITLSFQTIDIAGAEINASLTVGTTLKAEGRLNTDGSLIARQINTPDDDDDNESEFTGILTSYTNGTMVINSHTVDVSTAEIESGITVGDLVEVEGLATGPMMWKAREVDDCADPDDDCQGTPSGTPSETPSATSTYVCDDDDDHGDDDCTATPSPSETPSATSTYVCDDDDDHGDDDCTATPSPSETPSATSTYVCDDDDDHGDDDCTATPSPSETPSATSTYVCDDDDDHGDDDCTATPSPSETPSATSTYVCDDDDCDGTITPTTTPTAICDDDDDDDDDCQGTVTPTTTPVSGQTIERIAPANNSQMRSAADYVARFQWKEVSGASWYHVFVSTPDFSTVVHDRWYQGSEVCSGGVCTLTDTVWLTTNGEYAWWMTYWNDSIGSNYMNLYQESRFVVNYPLSTPVQATGAGATSWNADPNTLWYQVWVGPSDYSTTSYLAWLDAADICAAGVCSVTVSGLPSGSYELWTQGWNPAGVSPWSQVSSFTQN